MKITYHLRFLLLIIFIIQLNPFYNLNAKTILIDEEKKHLIAPQGCHYQWYYNGAKLDTEVQQDIAAVKTGTYQVKLIDAEGTVTELGISVLVLPGGKIIKFVLIGDSTVSNKAENLYPENGWGMQFGKFFDESTIQVQNFAISGTSTGSFYARSDGWPAAKKVIASGDYVFIQFGHNDQKNASLTAYGGYTTYLRRYVNEINALGGIPVFVTSVSRNLWNGDKFNATSLGDYPDAMKKLGAELKIPVIDLNASSAKLFASLGEDYLSEFIFNNYNPGEWPNYPSGLKDKTHFQQNGAIEISRLVVAGIKELSSTSPSMKVLISYLKPVYEVKIGANPALSASMISRTTSYPAGINVTLETIPKNSGTFVNWINESSKPVSNKVIYSFIMPDKSTSYTALYKNGVVTSVEEIENANKSNTYPNPFMSEFTVKRPGNFNYILLDLNGYEIEKGSANGSTSLGSNLNSGCYIIYIISGKETEVIKLLKCNK